MAGIEIDGVNNKIDFDDDKDTSISANVDDTLVIESGGANIASITAGEFAINEGSADIDFRVESDSNTHMLFVEGGADKVGINNSSPTRTFSIGGDGIAALEGSSNALTFYDSSTFRAYITSQSFGDHNGDGLGIVTATESQLNFLLMVLKECVLIVLVMF